MDAIKLIEKIYRSPAVSENISMQVQLGLPRLVAKNGFVALCFLPHIETLNGQYMEFYPAMYNLSIAYPSGKLLSFSNLSFTDGKKAEVPSAKIDVSVLIGEAKQKFDELYDILGDILENCNTEKPLEVDRYNHMLESVVKQFNLEDIYQF